MRVLWTLSAEQDRADIIDFIAEDNPLAAVRMDELFAAAVERLANHPLLPRRGHALVPHTASIPVTIRVCFMKPSNRRKREENFFLPRTTHQTATAPPCVAKLREQR